MKRGPGRAECDDVAGLQLLPRHGRQARAFAVLNDAIHGFDEIRTAFTDDAGVLLAQIRIAENADVGGVGAADAGRTLRIKCPRLAFQPP